MILLCTAAQTSLLPPLELLSSREVNDHRCPHHDRELRFELHFLPEISKVKQALSLIKTKTLSLTQPKNTLRVGFGNSFAEICMQTMGVEG